jgi:tetratricopeptide (TPR) repeat protein
MRISIDDMVRSATAEDPDIVYEETALDALDEIRTLCGFDRQHVMRFLKTLEIVDGRPVDDYRRFRDQHFPELGRDVEELLVLAGLLQRGRCLTIDGRAVDADELYETGLACLDNGAYDDAAACAATLMRFDGQKAEYYRLQVRAEAGKARQKHEDLYRLVGEAGRLARDGKFPDALSRLNDARNIDDRNPDVHYQVSQVLLRWHEREPGTGDRLKRALVFARRAVELDPNNVDYRHGLMAVKARHK